MFTRIWEYYMKPFCLHPIYLFFIIIINQGKVKVKTCMHTSEAGVCNATIVLHPYPYTSTLYVYLPSFIHIRYHNHKNFPSKQNYLHYCTPLWRSAKRVIHLYSLHFTYVPFLFIEGKWIELDEASHLEWPNFQRFPCKRLLYLLFLYFFLLRRDILYKKVPLKWKYIEHWTGKHEQRYYTQIHWKNPSLLVYFPLNPFSFILRKKG